MSKNNTDLTATVIILLAVMATVFLVLLSPEPPFRISQPTAPVDNCPAYITVESVTSEYRGVWAGRVTTLTAMDGSTYSTRKQEYAKGQRICVDEL